MSAVSVIVEPVTVAVVAADPISRAGIASQLRVTHEVYVTEGEANDADVTVVIADTVNELTSGTIRRLRASGCRRVLAVVSTLDDAGLFAAVEAGACGVLRRTESTPERLAAAVLSAAAGDGTLPPDLLGRLLDQVQQLQRQVLAPRGLTLSGLSARETDVLRLVAEGYDTAEVAQQLCYSERTVKNIIHDVVTRLQLRNRSHAVAYAVRHGLI
jgi:DNA-binding NarL/FixJ family response regulator